MLQCKACVANRARRADALPAPASDQRQPTTRYSNQ
jgi:hypothetical protein